MMTRQQKRAMGLLLGVAALVVIIMVAARDSGSDTAGLDENSYKAGYETFGGAYLPASDEDREAVEARCEVLFGEFPTRQQLDKESWVAGCADYVEDRKSRF